MQVHQFNYKEIGLLSSIVQDYMDACDCQQDFYKYPFSINSIAQVMQDKQSPNRALLVQELHKQYINVAATDLVKSNIELLAQTNTYTITTAHQPNIFTGYLYFVNKIACTIAMAKKLNVEYPDNNFVPVYWMGSEDHDFEEINHIYLFGEKLSWENDEQGAVGHMNTAGLAVLIDTIEAKLSNETYGAALVGILRNAYNGTRNLAEATQYLVNELFGVYGLVVVLADTKALKAEFVHVIQDEVFEGRSGKLASETIAKLESCDYKIQANPRDINMFYLVKGSRERIVKEADGSFVVLNTTLKFSAAEMQTLIKEHPERFSPNVFLRPLYQEFTLPNLAYIGGAGEVAYWLELKAVFDYFGVNYPMLVLRNVAAILDANSNKKREKLGLELIDLFADTDELLKRFVKDASDAELELSKEKQEMEALFNRIKQTAIAIDASLEQSVNGVLQGQLKALENLEAKLIRAEKKNYETAINQIRSVKEKVFPNGKLMERETNFLPYYAKYGPVFIQELVDTFDAFEQKFTLFIED